MNSVISRPASACAKHAMKDFGFSCFLWVLGLIVFSLAFPQYATGSAIVIDPNSPAVKAVLSGVLFYDKDHDGKLDQGYELAFDNITIELYKGNSTTPLMTTTTSKTGQFSFDNLTAGTYMVRNTYDAHWLPVAGNIVDSQGKYKTTGLGIADVDADEISGISLAAGDTAYVYNFAAQAYPIQLLSKRNLLASSADIEIHAVPEPSALIMLITAACALGLGMLAKRFS